MTLQRRYSALNVVFGFVPRRFRTSMMAMEMPASVGG